jgi:hypothetical protein
VDDDEAMTGSDGWSRGVGHCRRATMEALQWGLPLASSPMVISPSARVCRVLCGHGEDWFPCPHFLWHCVRGGTLPQEWRAPPIRARIAIDSGFIGDRGAILP